MSRGPADLDLGDFAIVAGRLSRRSSCLGESTEQVGLKPLGRSVRREAQLAAGELPDLRLGEKLRDERTLVVPVLDRDEE